MSNKKEQIFNAVIEHIKKTGFFSNIKIADIAKDADMGKGTVYEYFSSKEEIMAETTLYMMEKTKERILNQYDIKHDFALSLKSHCKMMIEIFLENSSYHSLLMSNEMEGILTEEYKHKITNKIVELQDKYLLFMKMILEKGVKENKFIRVEDDYVIRMINSTIVSSAMYYIHNILCQNVELSMDAYVDKIYNLILKMVA